MKKPVIVYMNGYDNPVDLESLDDCAGKLEFESLKGAFNFIKYDFLYKRVEDEFEHIFVTYDMVQKYLKRYGYFKAYMYLNGYFLSFMVKYI